MIKFGSVSIAAAVACAFVSVSACSKTDNGSVEWGTDGSGASQTIDLGAGSSDTATFDLIVSGNGVGTYMITTSVGGDSVFTALDASPTTVAATDGSAAPISVNVSVGSAAGTGQVFINAADIDDGTDSATATLTVVVQ